jgi:hypothetical protein
MAFLARRAARAGSSLHPTQIAALKRPPNSKLCEPDTRLKIKVLIDSNETMSRQVWFHPKRDTGN